MKQTPSLWLICTLTPDESHLVNLSTGTVTPPVVVEDLLRAFEVREELYQSFKRTRLDDDPSSVKFHDKMTKQRLKTFSSIIAKSYRMKGQHVVLKAHRNLFSQMILVAECTSVTLKDVHWAHFHGHWQMQMCPYEKQTRPHLPGSLRKMHLLQTLTQLHPPVYDWWDMVQNDERQQQNICTTGSLSYP